MTCEQCRERIDAYVDDAGGLVGSKEFSDIEAHLRSCPGCAAEVVSRIQLKRVTRAAASRYVPSPAFRLQVEKSIQHRQKPTWAWMWMPGLAAAVLIVAVAVLASFLVRREARQEAVAQLVDMHVAMLASSNPVDVVSTDRHTVKPWFQGKLPFTFDLPELQGTQYKLLGGKLVYIRHSPSAQLVFELRKHELSTFIAQDNPPFALATTGQSAAQENGFSVESWSQAGLRYVIVSDAGPNDVHELANLFKKP